MAWPGFFSYGGIEIINASRTEAYARRGNVGWFKPVYKESELAWLLGDGKYTSALQDDAPWTDPENLDSYDFLGVYPLEITGIEDSTVGASITESVIDGGYIGRSRRSTKAVVFNAVLSGLSECAVEYGLRWLRTVLSGNPCFGSAYGNCGGADLCYLACAPVIGDPPTTISEGPIVVDAVNLATNPNVEVGQDGGWYTNDPAKWVISAPTAGAISGTRSVMATRLADVLDRTNLALNPNLETNATGWNTNSVAAYPVTLDTGSAMSGINSLRTDRTATSLSTACASIQLTTAGTTSAGFPCTPGVPMTTSLNVKCSLANRRVSMSYQWLDGANAVISSTTPTNKVSDTGAALSVVRAVNTDTPPSGAVTCRAIVTVATLGGNATVGERAWFDSLLVEKDPTATPSTYFDGGTPDTGAYDYRWSGTANASTSQRWKASDASAASLYFTADVSTPFGVTPGEPITFGIDVKVEQPNRRITGYFSWIGGGASPAVGIPAGPVGTVTRFVMTGTPPAGVTAVYPVVDVTSTTGSALNGERVWWDNLYVGNVTSGDYFDGSTPDDGDLAYGWTGADNASTSRRFVQTWVNDPPPPPEECYERVGRSLHEVTITVGPSVTAKMEMNDGGVAWTVTWTAVAANPVEYGMERPLIVGFLDPAVDIPYAEGAVPVGGGFDEDGYVQTEVKCPTAGFVPVFDPLCKLLVPPPDVPAVAPTCFSFPVNYTRRSFLIPKSKIPLWGQVVPIVQLTTTTTESRSVRLRFYADVFDTGSPNDDPCNFCGDMLVSYIPPGSTLVLDGTDHSVYIDQPGQGRRRADSLVSDSSGNPFEWPEFSCGFGYVVTVDLPQQTAHLPIVDLSLVPRAA